MIKQHTAQVVSKFIHTYIHISVYIFHFFALTKPKNIINIQIIQQQNNTALKNNNITAEIQT